VGAAAFAAGVTRTMSSAVIVFEITGQLDFAYPVLVAVLFAYLTGNKLSLSIYDSVAKLRGLPMLGVFSKNKSYMRQVDEIMDREMFYLPMHPTYLQIEGLLDATPFSRFPIVDTLENMRFVGTLSRTELENCLSAREQFALFRMRAGLKGSNVKLNEDEEVALQRIASDHAEDSIATEDDLSPPATPLDASFLRTPSIEEETSDRTRVRFSEQGGGHGVGSWTSPDTSLSKHRKIFRHKVGGSEIEMTKMKSVSDEVASSPRVRAKYLSKTCDLETLSDKIEPHPFCISDVTPLRKVHFMFSVMGLHHAFVTNSGRLIGVVTKMQLAKDDL